MKKSFIILSILISTFAASAQSIHSFAENSVLASGKFVKIKIIQSGIYRLTFDDLRSMGVNPANVRIFGYGGNVLEQNFRLPMTDDLPEIAIYTGSDYILFYANGIDKWTYSNTSGLFSHQPNPYANFACYFVTSDAGTGKKIETAQKPEIPQNTTVYDINTFTDYQVYEREVTNIAKTGKMFYGDPIPAPGQMKIDFSSPNPAGKVAVTFDVAASGRVNSSFTFSLGDYWSSSVSLPKMTGDYQRATAAKQTYMITPSGDNLSFQLAYSGGTNCIGYLNALTVNAIRYLKMSGTVMRFQNLDYLGSNAFKKYKLSNASSNVKIWNITDTENITQMPVDDEGGAMTFTVSAEELQKFIAVDLSAGSQFPKPEIIGAVAAQNLHSLPAVDYVIITHPNFMTQAERLAQIHREADNMRVAVVTTEQVYNEFSSGAPDATAYRRFLKMFYNRAATDSDKPKYLLLFGRGTYDNRKLLSSSGGNFILTYQANNSLVITSSFATDDYFVLLDDNEGVETSSYGFEGSTMDAGVGRLPVTNAEEAETVVTKIANYIKNTEKGIWKNQLCFVADDGDVNTHINDAENVSAIIDKDFPAYNIRKIYLDAYRQETTASGNSYPDARTALFNQIRKGLFYINYSGHAGLNGWADEQIMMSTDIDKLTNRQLPLWLAVTCDFLMFDNRTDFSAGERVLLNPNGGGIGVVSATRPTYADKSIVFNKNFCTNMLKKDKNGKHYRLGDLIRIAKNSIEDRNDQINKHCYILAGDPALMLNYPEEYGISTDSINGHLQTGNDTVKALSQMTLKGTVRDENGAKAENFNGKITVAVYDQQQHITTLGNKSSPFRYYEWNSTLFSGKTTIKNGEYSLTFMLPKDLRPDYGHGRINYYAVDTVTNAEGQGWFENFTLGGIIDSELQDNEGPVISIVLNTPDFSNGDRVNETPLLIAEIEDRNGINMAGSGIGHDLLVTIDGDMGNSIVVNDFYEAADNNFRRGTLQYRLPELANGKHTLSLRAWDLLNNSTVAKIEFETVNGLAPNIFSVSNYPNPMRKDNKSMRIIIAHDRPETLLNITVDIFDISGRLIKTFAQTNTDDIVWDMTGGNGLRIKGGMYICRVTLQAANSDTYSKSNKILVIE